MKANPPPHHHNPVNKGGAKQHTHSCARAMSPMLCRDLTPLTHHCQVHLHGVVDPTILRTNCSLPTVGSALLSPWSTVLLAVARSRASLGHQQACSSRIWLLIPSHRQSIRCASASEVDVSVIVRAPWATRRDWNADGVPGRSGPSLQHGGMVVLLPFDTLRAASRKPAFR